MAEVLQLLKPITISGSKLSSSQVAEPATGADPDPAAWSSATTYTVGQRVHVASTHLIYEATTLVTNLNKDPTNAANAGYWLTVGATNKWRMFDQKSTSTTSRVGALAVIVAPGTVFNALALVNIHGADLVQVVQTDPSAGEVLNISAPLRRPPSAVNHYAYCFDPIDVKDSYFLSDMPAFPNSTVWVNLVANNGTSVVSVGAMLIGPNHLIGKGIQYGARLGITDYSKKTVNGFGDLEIVEGAFSSKASFQQWIDNTEVDSTKRLLTSVRAVPCLWRGSPTYDSTQVYGIYRDWEITLQYFDVSLLSIDLEGITEQ
jgi:hypothetical protein